MLRDFEWFGRDGMYELTKDPFAAGAQALGYLYKSKRVIDGVKKPVWVVSIPNSSRDVLYYWDRRTQDTVTLLDPMPMKEAMQIAKVILIATKGK